MSFEDNVFPEIKKLLFGFSEKELVAIDSALGSSSYEEASKKQTEFEVFDDTGEMRLVISVFTPEKVLLPQDDVPLKQWGQVGGYIVLYDSEGERVEIDRLFEFTDETFDFGGYLIEPYGTDISIQEYNDAIRRANEEKYLADNEPPLEA